MACAVQYGRPRPWQLLQQHEVRFGTMASLGQQRSDPHWIPTAGAVSCLCWDACRALHVSDPQATSEHAVHYAHVYDEHQDSPTLTHAV